MVHRENVALENTVQGIILELQNEFPLTIFNGRLSKYMLYSSVTIEWWDGPTRLRVKEYLRSLPHTTNYSLVDASGYPFTYDYYHPRLQIGADGVLIKSIRNSYYVSLVREYSKEVLERYAREVAERHNVAIPKVVDSVTSCIENTGVSLRDLSPRFQKATGKYFELQDGGVMVNNERLEKIIFETLRAQAL